MSDITVYRDKSELKETSSLTVSTGTTGEIDRVIFPNPVQVGLNHREFKSNLCVYGNIISRASGDDTIRGSLTKLLDGTPYIIAGSNISCHGRILTQLADKSAARSIECWHEHTALAIASSDRSVDAQTT